MGYTVESLSRNDLQHMASHYRAEFGLEDILYFPVMPFFEHAMPMYFEGFHYEIVTEETFPRTIHADTDIANRIIRIREDVYLGAVAGKGRDRMTIMHEIAHYFLLVHCGVKFNRAFSQCPVKVYRDPEWQAKALAGGIMCPVHLINSLSPEQVADLCGVSMGAAKFNVGLLRG